jgi:hypothetical protein
MESVAGLLLKSCVGGDYAKLLCISFHIICDRVSTGE